MGQTHVEILDEENLSDLVEQEPSDKDEEIPLPQIMNVKGVSVGDVSRSIHRVESWGSAVQSTRLVRAEDFRVYGQARRVSRHDVVTVAPQGDAHELVVHESTPS